MTLSGTEINRPSDQGNLLGIQPVVSTRDYASEPAFYAAMDGYLSAARAKGWLTPKTIAVFPEYVGAWLVAAGEADAVYRLPTMQAAMLRLVLRYPCRFVRGFLAARGKDRAKISLFQAKAEAMAGIFHRVFSRLAKRYGITIVPGSTILPVPEIRDGVLVARPGAALQNVTVLYRSDGTPDPRVVRKTFLTNLEHPFLTEAPVPELPVFDTPAGKLGVLICADSWYPEPYAEMRRKGAELIVVPSCLVGVPWQDPWRGYDGHPTPSDVDLNRPAGLTEAQAWQIHALPTRLQRAGARSGINVFLRGALWDLVLDGSTIAVDEHGTTVLPNPEPEAALVNLWLTSPGGAGGG